MASQGYALISERDDKEAEDRKESCLEWSSKWSGMCTCKSVLSWACALGSYFLGNGVTIVSKDGACVCGLEGVSEQKATYEGIVTKEKAGSCSKKAKTCSETGSRTSLLWWYQCMHSTFVHPQDPCGQKELLLVGPYCKPYFLYSWLAREFSNVTSNLSVCDELRSAIEKANTKKRKAIPVEQSCFDTLVSGNQYYRMIGHLFGV